MFFQINRKVCPCKIMLERKLCCSYCSIVMQSQSQRRQEKEEKREGICTSFTSVSSV